MATDQNAPAPHPPLRFLIGHRPSDDTRHCLVDFKAQAAWKSHEDADSAWGDDGVTMEAVIVPELDATASKLLGLLRAMLRELGDHDERTLPDLLSRLAKACYEAGLRGHETVADRLKRLTDSLQQRP